LNQYNKTTDEQLIEGITNADEKAFEQVYNRYWYKLFSVAYHQLGTKEDAEQIVHDVFEKLWLRRKQLSITNLSIYLVISVKNLCVNFIKSQLTFRKYQEYLLFQEIHQTDISDTINSPENLEEAIEKALKKLPEKTALVFKMSKFENQTNRAISAQLNLTEKAVEYHITKSLKHLRENLKSYYSAN
jgi:RNA polymerase sigma-70 factor (ECF subfamily)